MRASSFDPFAPVRCIPTGNEGPRGTGLWAIVLILQQTDGSELECPVGRMFSNCFPISNLQVVEYAQEILTQAFPGARLKADRTLFDGKQFNMRWPLPVEAAIGKECPHEVICLTASAFNRYDGLPSCGLHLNALVKACTNGLVVSRKLGRFPFVELLTDAVGSPAERERIATEIAAHSQWEFAIKRFERMTVTPLSAKLSDALGSRLGLPATLQAEIAERLTGDTVWSLSMAATAALRDAPTFAKEEWNRRISEYLSDQFTLIDEDPFAAPIYPKRAAIPGPSDKMEATITVD